MTPRDVLDQVFPHLGDWRFRRTIDQRIEHAKDRDSEEYDEYVAYTALEPDQLHQRLGEEKDRAEHVDDKTIRFLAALTIGFALLGVVVPLIVDALESNALGRALIGIAVAAGLYLLDAAYLAIQSMRTEALYGYGSKFLLDLRSDDDSDRRQLYIARDLWNQEQMNHRRSIRNEAVYLALRNGYLLDHPGRGRLHHRPGCGAVLSAAIAPQLRQAAAEEAVDSVCAVHAGGSGEVVEAVGGLGEHVQVRLVAGCLPAGGHEEGVIQQRVERADDEDRGWHVVQTGQQRRDIGVVAVRGVHVVVDEPLHDRAREDQVALAPEPR